MVHLRNLASSSMAMKAAARAPSSGLLRGRKPMVVRAAVQPQPTATSHRTGVEYPAFVPERELVIRVWSDAACPWCYIGKQRLDQAIVQLQTKHPRTRVTVQYQPFVIDPKTDPAGESYGSYTLRRWGGDAWTQELRDAGRRENAHFLNWKTWPATLKAHQLIAMANHLGGPNKGADAKLRIFLRTYEEGGNVSLVSELAAIADEVGIPGGSKAATEALEAGTYLPDVLEADTAAKKHLGVTGVPYYLISGVYPEANDSYALRGAQTPDKLLEAMERAMSDAWTLEVEMN